jgi:hypothetical protein
LLLSADFVSGPFSAGVDEGELAGFELGGGAELDDAELEGVRSNTGPDGAEAEALVFATGPFVVPPLVGPAVVEASVAGPAFGAGSAGLGRGASFGPSSGKGFGVAADAPLATLLTPGFAAGLPPGSDCGGGDVGDFPKSGDAGEADADCGGALVAAGGKSRDGPASGDAEPWFDFLSARC